MKKTYNPKYKNSHALVIGINEYSSSPLEFATNDASAVSKALIDVFSFPKKNIHLLKDKDATRENIFSNFMSFSSSSIDPDDRLIVFFAGHGITKIGNRGEVGYLVPVDGKVNDLSTLIRWDDLTRNADLIPAKHILFVMDACYGGIAITRNIPQGGMRFAKDMMQRYSRQVITAGKADEPVSDGNGPRKGHSIFTGYFLNALEGEAKGNEGIITANGVMSYVYQNVANDQYSQQTPHFGFLEGDGDFIFDLPTLEELKDDVTHETDILVQSPIITLPPKNSLEISNSEQIKEYLSDQKFRIKLDETVSNAIRRTLHATREDLFSLDNSDLSYESFIERLKNYEEKYIELSKITILLSRWADFQQAESLRKIISRVPDNIRGTGGSVVLLSMRWYPMLLLMYAGGIAAISANQYHNLANLFLTPIGGQITGGKTQPVIMPTAENILELTRAEVFKRIPGHERHYAPQSEYVFKIIQPILEDELFLGKSYEALFDRFEILYTLNYADLQFQENKHLWGPPGRFAWKHRNSQGADPFTQILSEAAAKKNEWEVLKAGFFGGEYKRFEEVALKYKELMGQLSWY